MPRQPNQKLSRPKRVSHLEMRMAFGEPVTYQQAIYCMCFHFQRVATAANWTASELAMRAMVPLKVMNLILGPLNQANMRELAKPVAHDTTYSDTPSRIFQRHDFTAVRKVLGMEEFSYSIRDSYSNRKWNFII